MKNKWLCQRSLTNARYNTGMKQRLKLLAICSANIDRSPTAEAIFRGDDRVEVRSAGTSPNAKHVMSNKDIEWADHIACMETKHKQLLEKRFGRENMPPIHVLDIPDEYKFMDPLLIKLLETEIEVRFLNNEHNP